LTLASALLVSGPAFSRDGEKEGKVDGARLRLSARPTLTMQTVGSRISAPFATIYSPDGKRLAGVGPWSGYWEPGVCVWNATTGQLLFTRSWQTKKVALSVHFNDDGTLLAASVPLPSEKPGEVELWDAATGKSLRFLKGADAGPITFSPDGKLVAATGGRPASVGLWDVATGKKLRALEGNAHYSQTFSPDSKLLLGVGTDYLRGGPARAWNVATGKVIQALEGVSNGVAFSPDSKRVAAAGATRSVGVWEVASGRKVLEIRKAHINGVVNVAFSPDGKRLVTGGNRGHNPGFLAGVLEAVMEGCPPVNDGEVKIWDATTGTELLAFWVNVGGLGSLCLAPDGQHVAVTTISGSQVTIWNVERAKEPVKPDGKFRGKSPPVPKAE
jgi:WD40 repeat protein